MSMTPERLATLEWLLPGRVVGGGLYEGVPPRDSWTPIEGLPQKDLDHLLMEALRAVQNSPDVKGTEVEMSKQGPAGKVAYAVLLFRYDGKHTLGESDNPLHALLDAAQLIMEQIGHEQRRRERVAVRQVQESKKE